mgnify:FL=1
MPIIVNTSPLTTNATVSGNFGATGVDIFNHVQYFSVTYASGIESVDGGTWPRSCTPCSTFEMELTVIVNQTITPYPLYAASGEQHGFQPVSANVCSQDSATGLGSNGMIYMNAQAVKWRPAYVSDQANTVNEHWGQYGPIIVRSPIHNWDGTTPWANDPIRMRNFVLEVIATISTGGYEYSDGNLNYQTTTTPIYEWDQNLVL